MNISPYHGSENGSGHGDKDTGVHLIPIALTIMEYRGESLRKQRNRLIKAASPSRTGISGWGAVMNEEAAKRGGFQETRSGLSGLLGNHQP